MVSIGMNLPAKIPISKGVINGAIKVETTVIVTDKATLAPAINAIKFDATPPDTDPIRTIPAASSPSNPKLVAIVNPITGIMQNWSVTSSRTGQGATSILEKSLMLRVVPIPNIIN